MKKYLLIATIGLMFMITAAGCGTSNNMNEEGQEMNNRNLERVNYKDDQANRDYVNDGMMRENYSLADREAGKVAELKEVRSAYVLTTDQNAYVAAVLEDDKNGNVSKKLEKKISDQVKKENGSINNVYVSTNPDFVDRMRGYADKARNGKPIEGFGEEIADMVKRVFPNRG
ncbi:YhcN/YlaJ family sporulation lipoprotein [Rossellomorea vietnamensis]|uniref:YhcN/YlaJ family sporulation lipoprotein n=1 Tax=Rossellomorea vietnamensis TaxID=218284 RepID=UPI001E2C2B56|nr:YhcN/YlaJ family sporulation lipoprotein [Rossellomorea vietnamensis]MCC5800652.1 YhcN/YlaJ family sporulation lipoprotein [Rossellomorea vietnamensis]